MKDRNDILLEINTCFPSVKECEGGSLPFDYVVPDAENNIEIGIIVKSNSGQEEKKFIKDVVADKIRNIAVRVDTILGVRINKNDQIEFGIVCYTEFNQVIYNKNIKWRVFSPENFEWLLMQLHAKRMNITSLPMKYFRVVKTIKLQSANLIDAEVVYFRKLDAENYKMSTRPQMDYLERFHRLLKGTPEEEYPKDELDILILKNIQKYYPAASVTSRLLLFGTELLDLRRYKDKQCETGKLSFMDAGGKSCDIELECYYYPNFRQMDKKPKLGSPYSINISAIDLCKTYEPLSALNV